MEILPFSLSDYTLEYYLVKISSRSKTIYWMIILIVTAGIVVLPFIYVDVAVQARGYFQSEIEKQIIYAPFQGRISYISIHDSVKVNRGDTLFIIDSEAILAQQQALNQQIALNDSAISDLKILTNIEDQSELTDYRISTPRYSAEYNNFRKQQIIQYQKYRKAKIEHERNQVLYKQKIIPDVDYENSLFAFTVEQENLLQILLYNKTLWQSDLSQRENEATRLKAEWKQFTEELNNRTVISPIDGEIVQNLDIQRGSMVSLNQKMAEISPDGQLIAACFLRPADIGLVHEKQKVRIQVDAFNYNEWGMLEGTIIDISNDMIVENGSTAFFRIKCRPVKTFLTLRNGQRASIKKGMSLNARIVVIRRSLFNLLFDKADKWFNPYTYTRE